MASTRFAPLEHDVAEVVLRLGLARVDLERAAVELLGVGLFALAKADVAEVRVRDGEPRIELEGLAVERLGVFMVAGSSSSWLART